MWSDYNVDGPIAIGSGVSKDVSSVDILFTKEYDLVLKVIDEVIHIPDKGNFYIWR